MSILACSWILFFKLKVIIKSNHDWPKSHNDSLIIRVDLKVMSHNVFTSHGHCIIENDVSIKICTFNHNLDSNGKFDKILLNN